MSLPSGDYSSGQGTCGADRAFTGAATITQTEWGMKPYSALFGALKVADEVEVTAEGNLPHQSR